MTSLKKWTKRLSHLWIIIYGKLALFRAKQVIGSLSMITVVTQELYIQQVNLMNFRPKLTVYFQLTCLPLV